MRVVACKWNGRLTMPEAQGIATMSARAQRFVQRLNRLPEPSFADLQRKRTFDRINTEMGESIAALIALLDARPALDSELNGSRLQAMALAVGEDRFDRLCNAEIPDPIYQRGATTLPSVDALVQHGEALLNDIERSEDVAHLARVALSLNANSIPSEATI